MKHLQLLMRDLYKQRRMASKFGSGALPRAAMLPHDDHGWAASGLLWKLRPREV